MEIKEIIKIEPELKILIHEATAVGLTDVSGETKNQIWYKVLKPRMVNLVGFDCSKAELNNTEAYENVYGFLIELLGI
jgi:hypothetical protein